jgi:hypothetical protein
VCGIVTRRMSPKFTPSTHARSNSRSGSSRCCAQRSAPPCSRSRLPRAADPSSRSGHLPRAGRWPSPG